MIATANVELDRDAPAALLVADLSRTDFDHVHAPPVDGEHTHAHEHARVAHAHDVHHDHSH